MREYIAGTMILPTVLAFVWMAVSWMYQDVIMSFNLAKNIASFIPCVIFIISGILFMTGTLDSDCKVFTEDLEFLTNGKLNHRATVPYYGLFVLFDSASSSPASSAGLCLQRVLVLDLHAADDHEHDRMRQDHQRTK